MEILNDLGGNFAEFINPKSVTMEQLYGQFDSKSNEWRDGIIPSVLRNFLSDSSKRMKWVSTGQLIALRAYSS